MSRPKYNFCSTSAALWETASDTFPLFSLVYSIITDKLILFTVKYKMRESKTKINTSEATALGKHCNNASESSKQSCKHVHSKCEDTIKTSMRTATVGSNRIT